MGAQQPHNSSSNTAASVFAWLLNVSSSVAIVFVNKVLMDQRGDYRFTFACTLSAIHFLTAAACIKGSQLFRPAEAAAPRLPWKDTLTFATVAVVSIGSLNLSLLVNPVGLYQVAKLLIIPFVCAVEFLHPQIQRRFTPSTVACIATVVVGVAVVTVNDLGSGSTKLLGVMLAGVSVVSSGMQQILCGTMQRQHKLQSHQLLAATSPVQGAMLLLLGPWVDAAVSGNWIGDYSVTSGAMGVLLLSCAISVAVNLSQFMCLGRFSAVTFQVSSMDGDAVSHVLLLSQFMCLGSFSAVTFQVSSMDGDAVSHVLLLSQFMCLGSFSAVTFQVSSMDGDAVSHVLLLSQFMCLGSFSAVTFQVSSMDGDAVSHVLLLSQFMCLGRFSAVTFQVLGHTKTILVLLISWLVLGEAMGSRKLAGMAVAVAGMVAYSYFMTMGGTSAKKPAANGSDSRSPAPGDAEDAADALELGRARERRGEHKAGVKKQQAPLQEEGDGSDVPLLRVVSRDNAEWNGDSVKMVVVERPGGSKQGSR
uniref:Sugar phosphate transporter domain-containing protein n=1 Tax=Tetradesmus obliquus TaxID=3088 RepID=A0A383WC72_TETOB